MSAYPMELSMLDALWILTESYWYMWLIEAEQATCNHDEMIDNSNGGPDSGYISMYCPKCGYSHFHHLY